MRQWTGPSLDQTMDGRLFGALSLSEPTLAYCQLEKWEQSAEKFVIKYNNIKEENIFKNIDCRMIAILFLLDVLMHKWIHVGTGFGDQSIAEYCTFVSFEKIFKEKCIHVGWVTATNRWFIDRCNQWWRLLCALPPITRVAGQRFRQSASITHLHGNLRGVADPVQYFGDALKEVLAFHQGSSILHIGTEFDWCCVYSAEQNTPPPPK